MTLIKKHSLALLVTTFVFTVAVLIGFSLHPDRAVGSVETTHEYFATSTASNTMYGATITASRLLKTGTGALGSVVITGAATGIVNFYNATTSNVDLRGGKASSTILIASFPASAATGTYTFDAAYSDGLFLVLESGTMPTSTVTYR